MGDKAQMKLSDIYATILSTVCSLTGETYVLDRSPQQNFSDGYKGTYRYIKPALISKERRSQGVPETIINVEVGILSLDADDTNLTAAEDELDGLLNTLLRRAQIADNLLIYAAQTSPAQEQYLTSEGLDSEIRVCEAIATISIRGYY